jgi:uncharacterized membrane protein YgcG
MRLKIQNMMDKKNEKKVEEKMEIIEEKKEDQVKFLTPRTKDPN